MKPFSFKSLSATSYTSVLEKLDSLRAGLRWSSQLERPEIERLLSQTGELREEIQLLSRKQRFLQAYDALSENAALTDSASSLSLSERRKALMDRNFVFEGVFGDNPKLLESFEIAQLAAPTGLPVLIEGESGTGKELLARVVHSNGRHRDGPFVSVNCGAIPEDLIESELFGHKKGAFTGATSDRKGKFESANGGTLFLDEIGELPLSGQVKILRALQAREIQRVGSDDIIRVDTRVVAATNRNLREMAQAGTFREDLYYRLSVIKVTLPPLRDRRDEIPLLIDYFCSEAASQLERPPVKMSRELRTFLRTYDYPGNIRELRNLVFRLSCLADDYADTKHLPEELRVSLNETQVPSLTSNRPLSRGISLIDAKKAASDEAEKEFLENALHETSGSISELARRIDMNRSHVQVLLKKHGIDFRKYRVANDNTKSRSLESDITV